MEIQEKQLKDNCIGNKSNGSKIEKIKSKSVAENKKKRSELETHKFISKIFVRFCKRTDAFPINAQTHNNE